MKILKLTLLYLAVFEVVDGQNFRQIFGALHRQPALTKLLEKRIRNRVPHKPVSRKLLPVHRYHQKNHSRRVLNQAQRIRNRSQNTNPRIRISSSEES